MAERTVIHPEYVAKLTEALAKALPGASVDAEQVRNERYRFAVLWPHFDGMGHPERQDQVWDIAAKTLDSDSLRNVTMILTLGQDDLPKDEP
jgi:hypothetical protein